MFYIINQYVKGEDVTMDIPFTTRENAMEWVVNHFTSLGYTKDWYEHRIGRFFRIEYVKQKHYTEYLMD